MARIFAYRGIIGMSAMVVDETAEGGFTVSKAVVNDYEDPNQLGVICEAEHCEISQEALELMKTIPKSRDCIGELDVFGDKDKVIIGWLGGLQRMIDPKADGVEGSRDHEPSLLEHLSVVPNYPPQEFKDAVDGMLGAEEPAEA